MAAIDDVKTQWLVKVALISDALIKAEATYALDRYIAALTGQASLESNEIVSYTIAGRTFTRRDTSAGKQAIADLRLDLHRLCYGSVSLADMNTEQSTA